MIQKDPNEPENDNNYTFHFCSGNGQCDTELFQCQCDEGFAGNDCSEKYVVYKYQAYEYFF